jgi:hypothetical protein
MKASMITSMTIATALISSGAPHVALGQTSSGPEAAAVIVASETHAVVENIDKQVRQVLLHLPEDTLLTLTVPPEVKTIEAQARRPGGGEILRRHRDPPCEDQRAIDREAWDRDIGEC